MHKLIISSLLPFFAVQWQIPFVAEWTSRLRRQIEPFLDFDGPAAATMVDNVEWTAPLSAIELLRDIGKHFSVNRMLDREAVSVRLAGPGISYTEFSYVLLQSNDYLELHRRYGYLQLGGSDQWGNITAGVELIRRVTSDRVHALSTPLLTKADGTKFGKTESGALWLDPSLTSPYAFYQYWVNADDRDVVRYLRVFSFRSREEIEELQRAVAQRPAGREAQRALARDLTALLHGAAEAERAVAASRALFGQGEMCWTPTSSRRRSPRLRTPRRPPTARTRTCSWPPAWCPASRRPDGPLARAGCTRTTAGWPVTRRTRCRPQRSTCTVAGWCCAGSGPWPGSGTGRFDREKPLRDRI